MGTRKWLRSTHHRAMITPASPLNQDLLGKQKALFEH